MFKCGQADDGLERRVEIAQAAERQIDEVLVSPRDGCGRGDRNQKHVIGQGRTHMNVAKHRQGTVCGSAAGMGRIMDGWVSR
jgi:hypothetical protein